MFRMNSIDYFRQQPERIQGFVEGAVEAAWDNPHVDAKAVIKRVYGLKYSDEQISALWAAAISRLR
jgi:hypothetical protein